MYVRKIALYSDLIHSFDWKSAVVHDGVFKMRDSVPSGSYSSVCNVLRQWNIPLIPTYRVYRLYDIYIVRDKSVIKLHNHSIIIYKAGVAWE